MIVTCPNCGTKFNLPEERVRPNAKLRCSVCKHVFVPYEADLPPLPDEDDAPEGETIHMSIGDSGSSKKTSKGKKGRWIFALLFLLVILAGAGVYVWYYTPYLQPFMQHAVQRPQEDQISRIALNDVRQYPVNNEKTGSITVIEGKVINGFADPRELIRVEAALYDKNGKVLVSKQQLAGNAVSLFQLQMLGEQELEQALANKLGVLTYNTNVASGGEVPFMVVFYNPPENAAEFGVKVVDAQVPPAQK